MPKPSKRALEEPTRSGSLADDLAELRTSLRLRQRDRGFDIGPTLGPTGRGESTPIQRRQPTFTFARDEKPDLDTPEGLALAQWQANRYAPRPEEGFSTPGEAADAALANINQLSADARREYGGDIYQLPNNRYTYTSAVTSGLPEHVVVPDVFPSDAPKGAVRVGDYHTHGGHRDVAKPGPKDTSRRFSGGDLTAADARQNENPRNYYAYMANPEGEIYQYDPGMIPEETRKATRRDERAVGIAPDYTITRRGQIPMKEPRVSAPEKAIAQAATKLTPPSVHAAMSLPRLPEGVSSEQAMTESFLEEQERERKRLKALEAMRAKPPTR